MNCYSSFALFVCVCSRNKSDTCVSREYKCNCRNAFVCKQFRQRVVGGGEGGGKKIKIYNCYNFKVLYI